MRREPVQTGSLGVCMQRVYRIVSLQEWQNIQDCGYILASKLDVEYLHLSLKEHVEETANLYFQSSEQLVVLEINAERLTEGLLFEPVESRNNGIFPQFTETVFIVFCDH